ncbi:MAG: 2-C-methyl-D-erythritol 4-phosphate cytidylyltransferase [Candidatus Omnitrophica bacterium]|nr:2-C-methyl-D-erythritol 4-phosphate cytidylyltransferase [Candidatus Omnitrophota bacterium]
MRVTAIVPAAGAGSRIAIKKGRRKPFLIVNDKPILIHTLIALERSGVIDDIIVVVHRDDVARCITALRRYGLRKITRVIAGGKTRFESVRKGLFSVKGNPDAVIVHDGVRPIIDKDIISKSIKACRRFGAAVCGVPATSTHKLVRNDLTVKATADRRRLYSIQTPQVFKKDIILKAYKRYARCKQSDGITDDSVLVEKLGYKVKVVPGSYENIKITTPQDLILAKMLLKRDRFKAL